MYDVLVKNGRIVTADRVSEGNIAIRDLTIPEMQQMTSDL